MQPVKFAPFVPLISGTAKNVMLKQRETASGNYEKMPKPTAWNIPRRTIPMEHMLATAYSGALLSSHKTIVFLEDCARGSRKSLAHGKLNRTVESGSDRIGAWEGEGLSQNEHFL